MRPMSVIWLVSQSGQVTFSHRSDGARPLTLTGLITRRRGTFVLACLVLLTETLLLQAGPYLIQLGIDHGIVPRDLPVLLAVSGWR